MTALRSLRYRKLFTSINIAGLALAVACSWLIGLWVLDELRFDQFLPNEDCVFRLETITTSPDGSHLDLPAVGWPVGKTIQANFPEVEQLTYVKAWSPQLKHKDAYVKEPGIMADAHFLDVLGYELAQGNPKTALTEPFSILLSPEAEAKYFGKGQGMGKVLMINDTLPHRVTGVFRTVPRQGHLQFTMVRSLASLHTLFPHDMTYEYADGWFDINVANYIRLKKGVNSRTFAAKIESLVSQWGREKSKQTGMHSTLRLRPLADIYLDSKMPTFNGPVGDRSALYLFSLIAAFVLLIASLNVINLTTAGASERAKEVGIKKALGGHPSQLMGQFLSEAALVCTTAVGLSAVLVVGLLPVFRTFTGKPFFITDLVTPLHVGLLVGFLLVLIPLTGVYPAWVLMRYQPVTALRGHWLRSVGGVNVRKGLVVAQFGVSIGLISCTIIAWQQVHYMRRQTLGFDQQRVIVIDLQNVSTRNRSELTQRLRQELLTNAQITHVTACNAVPSQMGWDGQFANGEGAALGSGILVEHIPVDPAYVQTLRLTLLAGRDLIASRKADESKSFLINEAAVKAFGWKTPQLALGKKLSVSGIDGQIVGVLKDYHQHGLQEHIRPLVLNNMPVANVVALRYAATDPTAVLHYTERVWSHLFPGYAFSYHFLDDAFQQQYIAEQRLIQLVSVAAWLAILISCLGLFGLATFTAQRRTKEIGVRKVLGASVVSIVTLLNADFLKLVAIAMLLASPIAYYAMHHWLQAFAYRMELSWGVFALAGLLAVGVALLTVSFQSIRAALMNPVKSLRSE